MIKVNEYEILMWLIYMLVGAGFLYFYKAYNSERDLRFYMQGYFVKMSGGLAFALIYILYYITGDTTEYFASSQTLTTVFYEDSDLFWQVYFSDNVTAEALLSKKEVYIFLTNAEEEWFFTRLICPLNILSFNSFLVTTFFMSLISFFGTYKMYKLMNRIYPGHEKTIFYLNFLLPSILFWGSGLLKDTVTLYCFYTLCTNFYNFLYTEKNKIGIILFSLLPIYIIFKLKVYILVCFFPWVLISGFLFFTNKSNNPVFKFLITPYLLILTFASAYFGTNVLLNNSADYKSDKLLERLKGFEVWHTKLKGSAYSLGEMEYTQIGLMKKIPAAINVSLFRPYPWEANTIMVLITSFESSLVLIMFIYALYKTGRRFFNVMTSSPFLAGAFFFILFFAFSIGISAFNFGALTRFKIPLVALSVFLLFYIIKKDKELKQPLI